MSEELVTHLCERGLFGLMTLWKDNDPLFTAYRTSAENSKSFYSTATLHWVLALSDCGIFSKEMKYERKVLKAFHLVVEGIGTAPPTRARAIDLLISRAKKANNNWVEDLLKESSHWDKKRVAHRCLIPAGHIAETLHALIEAHADSTNRGRTEVQRGLQFLLRLCIHLFSQHHKRLVSKVIHLRDVANARILNSFEIVDCETISPYLALSAAYVLKVATAMIVTAPALEPLVQAADQLKSQLSSYFSLVIDRIMARRDAAFDLGHDPASLAFALRGLLLLEPDRRGQPLTALCVQAIVNGQNKDGTWPDGISVSFSPTGDAIQTPSVQICLALAECVLQRDAWIHCTEHDDKLIAIAAPALEKMVQYLNATCHSVTRSSSHYFGWVSDRIRRTDLVETWTTALATRLLLDVSLINKIARRSRILKKYSAVDGKPHLRISNSSGSTSNSPMTDRWHDSIASMSASSQDPRYIIEKHLIDPIQKDWQVGYFSLRPPKNGVSFLIFGPPGSGKTYFVEKLADALGWPLLSVNPGHFIANGLDLIEATAAETFRDLMQLQHAVVFFDECDELLLDRDKSNEQNRNILSFVTACMLPKLQQLHDARQVVFLFATNYLRRIDKAIRRPGRFDHICLLDRPDTNARREMLESVCLDFNTFPSSDRNGVLSATIGLMAKEVQEVGRALNNLATRAIVLADPSRFCLEYSPDDYRDWCNKDGQEDLECVPLYQKDPTAKSVVIDRWSELSAFMPIPTATPTP